MMLILQVSGKYNLYNYIYQLIFVTSKGRSLYAGQPNEVCFHVFALLLLLLLFLNDFSLS